MGKYIAENTVKQLIKAGKQIKGARAAVMGITFKENCPDIRNSKVIDIIQELNEYGVAVEVSDPIADKEEVMREYNIRLKDMEDITSIDALIVAVKHSDYEKIKPEQMKKHFRDGIPVIIDVKGLFDKKDSESIGYVYWGL